MMLASRRPRAQDKAHRPLLLADTERLEGHHHARGVRFDYNMIAVNIAKGDQFKPEFLAISQTTACRQSWITTALAVNRSRSSSPAQFCSISAARPASSTQRRSAAGSKWSNGCFGRWPISARRQARRTISATTQRRSSLRHRALHERDEPHLWRHEQAAGGSRISRRTLFHSRHRVHRLGVARGAPRP